ncbi:hypothetical protein [Aquimarina sp. 433]
MKRINWKYAIGEIIIVIIGITIAFSLNNIKENRSNVDLKKQYLDNLAIDIEREIALLEENETKFNSKIKTTLQIQAFFRNPEITKRDSISRKVFVLARLINFTPQNTTYRTLVNSGDMKLIDNFDLRKSIEEHYSSHKNILQDYQRIEKINEKYLADFFIHKMDYTKIRSGNLDFLEDPLLKNIVSSMNGAYYIVLESGKKCLESNKRLLEEIKKEST